LLTANPYASKVKFLRKRSNRGFDLHQCHHCEPGEPEENEEAQLACRLWRHLLGSSEGCPAPTWSEATFDQDLYSRGSGSEISRKIGDATFKLNGHQGASPVIFGEKGDSALLGTVSLEALGLLLDPIRRELRPLPMVLGSHERRS
jgi:hypothetical protein